MVDKTVGAVKENASEASRPDGHSAAVNVNPSGRLPEDAG
ncbi:hypothetical protein SEEN449_14234 [Salmonella enterica subsp. enterica serovar Newport str. CVM 19449]|nr:hypothetical protein SEEN449_14234 [Salmonella enterica subsp. enterica serovar Newport str. CVM 19449]